jgi:phosphoserine phosphatase RsbU/P
MVYNILIVDDMMVNRKLMKKVLEATLEEICFYEAEDGFQALDFIEEVDVDLIILDLMMPGKDGFEVLKEIKALEKHKDIPVIVNSAISDMESIKRTLEMGAIDYFTKPITPDQMKVIIPLKTSNALRYYEQKKYLKEINERLKGELKIAGVLQRSLMQGKEDLEKVDIYKKYLPCDELGGDLYDYIELGDSFWFITADIIGHGVASAMIASMVKAAFNHSIMEGKTPKEVLMDINMTFCNMMPSSSNIYFSAFVGMIKDNLLTYSNAGHPYPILLRSNEKKHEVLALNGYLMGIFEHTEFYNKYILLEKEDVILAYTDGLYETNKDEKKVMRSYEDVYDFLENKKYYTIEDPEELITELLYYFEKQDNKKTTDDVAIILIKIK